MTKEGIARAKRPHLLIAPNGVVHQLAGEARGWFQKGAMDILILAGGEAAAREFFALSGPYRSSHFYSSGELHRIVIIASQNVIVPHSLFDCKSG